MSASVVVYSTGPGCARCRMTVRELQRLGVEHVVVDVTEQPEASALLRAMGYTEAPVVTDGRQWWSGFRPDVLRQLAGAVA